MRLCILVVLLALVSTDTGCSSKPAVRKATYPVTGEVYVDGQPANELAVMFECVGSADPNTFTISQATTGPDGKFAASTYEAGDGAPEGEYRVTFSWGQLNKISMQFEGDRLQGRYSNPAESQFKVKVEKGKPVDMGRIELKSS